MRNIVFFSYIEFLILNLKIGDMSTLSLSGDLPSPNNLADIKDDKLIKDFITKIRPVVSKFLK